MNLKRLETLEDIIQSSGLKLDKIAEGMNISTNYLWKLRQNPKKMDANQMVQLAEILNVNVIRLFNAIKNFID